MYHLPTRVGVGQGWKKPGFFMKNPAHWVLLGFLGFSGFFGFFGFYGFYWFLDGYMNGGHLLINYKIYVSIILL